MAQVLRQKRQHENLSQADLLKGELRLIGTAILIIALMVGSVVGIIWFDGR